MSGVVTVEDQWRAALLFHRYAVLNGIKEEPSVRTQRVGIDIYAIPGIPPARQSWIVWDLGDRKTEIALGPIAQNIENGADGQQEAEMRALLEFFGRQPVLVVRWKTFMDSQSV